MVKKKLAKKTTKKNTMAKKVTRNKKKVTTVPDFSRKSMLIFGAIFGLIGAALIWGSFALTPDDQEPQFSPDTVLIRLKPGVSQQVQDDLLNKQNAKVVSEIPQISVKVLRVPVQARDAVIEALSHNPNVEFAEKDEIMKPQAVMPNDPYFPKATTSLSSINGGAWGWEASRTTEAWGVTQGDPNVIIAILDTGLKPQGLKDFDGQISSTWNVLNKSSDVTTNAGNHGTYVAGAAGLGINNSVGNTGYCPKCKLMPIQVGDDSGLAISAGAEGLIYAADHGARVANMSFAGSTSTTTMSSAVAYARSKNVTMFAAAGNTNCDCKTYPSSYDGVMGIGGYADSGAKAGDSNYGTWVSFAAPQGNMTGWPSLNNAPGYAQVGGTSLASPAAAGMAALVLSARPTMTAGELEQLLISSAQPASFNVKYGRIDPSVALRQIGLVDPKAGTPPVMTSIPQIYRGDPINTKHNLALLTNAPQVGQVIYRGQGAWAGAYPLRVSISEWSRCKPDGTSCQVVSVGAGTYQYVVQSADAGFALKYTVGISNDVGTATASSLLTATIGGGGGTTPPPDTTVPTVNITTPPNGATVTGTININASGSDNVGVTKTEIYIDNVLRASSTSSSVGYSWDTRTVPNGSHTIFAKAYDAAGNAGTSTVVTVNVSNQIVSNQPPVVTLNSPIDGATIVGNINYINASATDDKAVTRIEVYVDAALKSTTYGSSVNYKWNTRKLKPGYHTIIVKAYDADGASSYKQIQVVRN